MRRYTIFLISLALLAVACKAGKSSFQSEVVNGEESRKQWQEIPSVITNVRDRAFYVLRNFWNDVSFKENVLHSQNTELDKKFLTFVRLLSRYPDSSLRRESVNIFVSKVEKSMEVYGYFVEQAEFYLYSPSSPIRDENLYKVFILKRLLKIYLEIFDRNFSLWQKRGFPAIKEIWLQNAGGLNEEISVNLEKKVERGFFRGIGDDGALLLDQNGSITRIYAGDVFYTKEKSKN